jgi:enoyl-CoA hydratase
MGADAVRVRPGRIYDIELHRPAVRNAVDRPTAEALVAAFRAFDDDDDASVAVFHGGSHFCAGADLHALADDPSRVNRLQPDGDGPMGPSRALLSKPVVAAIEGHAVAGGLELALWCDLRVAADDAVLGVFCRRWGVPLIDGGTVRLPRLIGLSRALDLILTGRPVGADEALQMGLVNRVVPAGSARAAAWALAEQLAAFPQATLRADRLSAYAAFDTELPEALRAEFERGVQVIDVARRGAGRFAAGAGRHGRFDDASGAAPTPPQRAGDDE